MVDRKKNQLTSRDQGGQSWKFNKESLKIRAWASFLTFIRYVIFYTLSTIFTKAVAALDNQFNNNHNAPIPVKAQAF